MRPVPQMKPAKAPRAGRMDSPAVLRAKMISQRKAPSIGPRMMPRGPKKRRPMRRPARAPRPKMEQDLLHSLSHRTFFAERPVRSISYFPIE